MLRIGVSFFPDFFLPPLLFDLTCTVSESGSTLKLNGRCFRGSAVNHMNTGVHIRCNWPTSRASSISLGRSWAWCCGSLSLRRLLGVSRAFFTSSGNLGTAIASKIKNLGTHVSGAVAGFNHQTGLTHKCTQLLLAAA